MEARVKLLIQTKLRQVDGMQERLVPDYPEWALRELLMNAVMHRNYDSNSPIRCYAFSDHIEIMSPGGLYGEATPENFPTRNSYLKPSHRGGDEVLGVRQPLRLRCPARPEAAGRQRQPAGTV